MPLERALRLVAAAERAVRERQRVVGGAQLGEQRDRALEVRDGRSCRPSAAAMRPSPNCRGGLGGRLAPQRLEQRGFAGRDRLLAAALGKLDARRQVAGRRRSSLRQPRGGLGVARQALQHDGVEIVPLERLRRERLRARVCLVRGVPLLPGVQRPRERAHS